MDEVNLADLQPRTKWVRTVVAFCAPVAVLAAAASIASVVAPDGITPAVVGIPLALIALVAAAVLIDRKVIPWIEAGE